MRLVRYGEEPSEVGVDIRAALSTWGEGCEVLGGVAVTGCTPPGSPRPLDAVIVLPRGVIAVIGTDLTQPALKLEAPIQTPWQVDGWPLVRDEGAINPGQDALECAAALARSLQSRGVDPLPVATVVAVGPYVEQVTQPTNDLYRGLRVVPPTTTSLLAAVRELATYERACPAESARYLLTVLGEDVGGLSTSELTVEGFPEAPARDFAAAATMLIPKVSDHSPVTRTLGGIADALRRSARGWLIGVAVVLIVGGLALFAFGFGGPTSTNAHERRSWIDGVEFVRESTNAETDCARNSSAAVRSWFENNSCTKLSRSTFATSVSQRRAAVFVTVIDLPKHANADELHGLLTEADNGAIAVPDTQGLASGAFDNSARSVEREDSRITVVRAAWAQGTSDPDDVRLRALAERGLRLPGIS